MLHNKITHPSTNEPVEVFVSHNGVKPTFNIIYKSRQLIFLIHDPESFTNFIGGITSEWVQYCLINNNQFLQDECGIMDEFFLRLN